MEIRLFGCKIYISLLSIAMICLILFFDSTGIILFGLCSVLIHETGHILFMAALKQMPDEIIMQPAGVIIKRKNLIMKYSDELLVATAGCLFNLIFGLCFISLYYVNYNLLWMIFAAANLSIAFFNLLPVAGLDGGDILKFFLYRIMPENKADTICKIIGDSG